MHRYLNTGKNTKELQWTNCQNYFFLILILIIAFIMLFAIFRFHPPHHSLVAYACMSASHHQVAGPKSMC